MRNAFFYRLVYDMLQNILTRNANKNMTDLILLDFSKAFFSRETDFEIHLLRNAGQNIKLG